MTFEKALEQIKEDVANRVFLNYHTGRDNELGRFIEVETDQGWNPSPIFAEAYYDDL